MDHIQCQNNNTVLCVFNSNLKEKLKHILFILVFNSVFFLIDYSLIYAWMYLIYEK